MDEATRNIISKIEKLARLAAKAGTPEEAVAATAKYQELLTTYNLDMATVEKNSGESGKRLDERISGGAYKYQQRLWEAIAQLNFCFYWTMPVRVDPVKHVYQAKRGRRFTTEHRLVGRQVNVIATRNMATYLEGTINRLCIERLGEEGRSGQFYSSWAMAFREGIADRVMEKIYERRRKMEKDEAAQAREAVLKAGREGVSTATALTIASVKETEKQANYDFLHGDGAWARKIAREEEADKRWAERRAEQAQAAAEAEKEYARWAKANPEEAAKEAAKDRARQRAKEARAERRGPRYYRASKEDLRRESGGYYTGYDVGAKVGIDPQTSGDTKERRRIGNASSN